MEDKFLDLIKWGSQLLSIIGCKEKVSAFLSMGHSHPCKMVKELYFPVWMATLVWSSSALDIFLKDVVKKNIL